MISQTVILALAGAASANFLQLRDPQFDYSPECQSALAGLESLSTAAPTQHPAISSWFEQMASTTITDACEVTVPPKVQDAISSLQSAWKSVYDENKDLISSANKACGSIFPDISELTSTFAVPSCTSTPSSDSGKKDDDKDDDKDDKDDDDSDDDDSKTEGASDGDKDSAASRPVGLFGMAVALAGFLGVVAAL
ncbi:hypothetical protein VTH06DRAFT_93 [Thermothelomyces fergusii]